MEPDTLRLSGTFRKLTWFLHQDLAERLDAPETLRNRLRSQTLEPHLVHRNLSPTWMPEPDVELDVDASGNIFSH